jgi:pilus assembly protein Flp/PilA
MLVIRGGVQFFSFVVEPSSIGGDRDLPKEQENMLNIVEKYSTADVVEAEDGVVAIEYVIVAGALVVALAALWTAFGNTLSAKLQSIVSSI